MRFRELWSDKKSTVSEDADASSTTSSDIATVAYPLFVGGKTKRQKRRNARAAVGQGYNAGPVGVGTGVYESEQVENPQDVVKMDVPFLVRALEYAREDAKNDLDIHSRIERMIDMTRAGQVLDMEDYEAVFGTTAFTQDISGLGEAHALDHQNVIYRLDKDKPMSNTEVLVIGGAGRYSLEGLRMKARREARALAQDLEIEHGGAFRRSAENIKQLVNTLNTIVAAYNELKRIRQKGGRGSRGITDEDANFIRECYSVAQRWTQRFNLVEDEEAGESPEDEAQEVKRAGQLIAWPAGTTKVKVSDVYDWYKIGMAISDLDDFSPEDFGQGPPETILAFGSEEEEQKFLPTLKKLGFKLTDIDLPGAEDIDEAYLVSDLIKHFAQTGN
jgi:hypothetical protein